MASASEPMRFNGCICNHEGAIYGCMKTRPCRFRMASRRASLLTIVQSMPWHALRIVGRPHYSPLGRKKPGHFSITPDMIAGGYHINTRSQDLLCNVGRQTYASCSIFPVNNYKIDLSRDLSSSIQRRACLLPGLPMISPSITTLNDAPPFLPWGE